MPARIAAWVRQPNAAASPSLTWADWQLAVLSRMAVFSERRKGKVMLTAAMSAVVASCARWWKPAASDGCRRSAATGIGAAVSPMRPVTRWYLASSPDMARSGIA